MIVPIVIKCVDHLDLVDTELGPVDDPIAIVVEEVEDRLQGQCQSKLA